MQDIFLSRQKDGGRLYRNLGGFQFYDATEEAGILSDGMWSTGVSFIDINNDGWLDLYVCGFDCPNKLYINDKGTFIESAKEYGLDYKGASVSMSFSDFDRDGDIDAYLLTNRLESTDLTAKAKIINDKNRPLRVHPDSRELGYFVRPPGRVPILINAGQYDYLYRNDGGHFVDVTTESGIGKNPCMWLMITWGQIIYFRIWELIQVAQSDLLMLQIRRYRILHGFLWALTIVILIMMVRWI